MGTSACSAPFALSALQRGVRCGRQRQPAALLVSGASVGLTALGVPPLLSSCGGDDDAPVRLMHQRTLFINLRTRACRRGHYLTGGGRRFTLTDRR
jgi:hypothetical protein